MYQEEYAAVGQAAVGKARFLQDNPVGYLLSSMLAGVYVGFGILLVFTIGGQLGAVPETKFVMGISFGVALSLVVMAGAELFTGNNLVMTGGWIQRKVTGKQTLLLWVVCFLGNWLGAVLLSMLFLGTGLAQGSAVEAFILSASEGKMSADALALFLRGMLCNMLVCLAVWCGFRCKSESGKLIMIFWCLFAFLTTGFEHSVANMTLLTTALCLDTTGTLTLGGYLYNLSLVTLGNVAGGVIGLAIPYAIIAKKKEV